MHLRQTRKSDATNTIDDSQDLLPLILTLVQEILHLLANKAKSHYTVEELAEQVGRAEYTVRKWIKDGLIKAIRVDGSGPKGRLLIPREELQRLLGAAKGARIPAVQLDDPVRSEIGEGRTLSRSATFAASRAPRE